MGELLPQLFRRAITGEASPTDLRILTFLADGPAANCRLFGLPLPGVTPYYYREYFEHIRFQPGPQREPGEPY